jgi:hypothetical protein
VIECLARNGFDLSILSDTILGPDREVDPLAWLAARCQTARVDPIVLPSMTSPLTWPYPPSQLRLSVDSVGVSLLRGPSTRPHPLDEAEIHAFLFLLDRMIEEFQPDLVMACGVDSIFPMIVDKLRIRGLGSVHGATCIRASQLHLRAADVAIEKIQESVELTDMKLSDWVQTSKGSAGPGKLLDSRFLVRIQPEHLPLPSVGKEEQQGAVEADMPASPRGLRSKERGDGHAPPVDRRLLPVTRRTVIRRSTIMNLNEPRSDPAQCVILVPVSQSIEPVCNSALRELERRGYTVRRVRGRLDGARDRIATRALLEGFNELMWIDPDIGFHPAALERLRSHELPITCGVYARKRGHGLRGNTRRVLACRFLDRSGPPEVGRDGELAEVISTAAGFLHTRSEVYQVLRERLGLPLCNERLGSAVVPFFQPLVVTDEEGSRYLTEELSFCHRVRECGFRIMADPSPWLRQIDSLDSPDVGQR